MRRPEVERIKVDRVPYLLGEIALAAGLLAIAALAVVYGRFRRRLIVLREETAEIANLTETIGTLRDNVVDLRSRLEVMEETDSRLSDWSSGAGGIHLNRRGQVLRLYRRGDSIANIATALGLSNGEVALIVKVQRIRISASGDEKPRTEF